MGSSLSGIHCDDAFDGAAADGAEGIVTSEHYAVFLGAVVAVGFIISAFKGADVFCIFVGSQQFVFFSSFFAEEGVHF